MDRESEEGEREQEMTWELKARSLPIASALEHLKIDEPEALRYDKIISQYTCQRLRLHIPGAVGCINKGEWTHKHRH